MKTILSTNEIALSKILNAGYDFKRINQYAVRILKNEINIGTFCNTEKGMYENAANFLGL